MTWLWVYLGGLVASVAMVVVNEDSYTFSQIGWVFLSALLWPLVALVAAWSVLDGIFGPPVRRWMQRRSDGQTA